MVNYKKYIKEYKNCKDITEIASLNILPEKQIEEVDSDWFSFYFERAKLVSDESMQKIWTSILAEEMEETIERLLCKYWDLRPSEAHKFIREGEEERKI